MKQKAEEEELREEAIQGTIDFLCGDCDGYCIANQDCDGFWDEVEATLKEWSEEE